MRETCDKQTAQLENGAEGKQCGSNAKTVILVAEPATSCISLVRVTWLYETERQRPRDRETARQRDSKTKRQRDRETARQRDSETARQRDRETG